MRKKYLFRKTIFDKVVEGVIKPLQRKKSLNVLAKSLKNTTEGSQWH